MRYFSRRKMTAAFTTPNGDLIKIHVLHQPEQSKSLTGSQIILPLLELAGVFAVGNNRVPFIQAVGFLGSFQNVGDFTGQFAFGNTLLVGCWETVGDWQTGSYAR